MKKTQTQERESGQIVDQFNFIGKQEEKQFR